MSMKGHNGLLAMAAMMALTATPLEQASRRQPDWWGDAKHPDNRGRRAEKNAAALAKADEKRKRRAAKRASKLDVKQNVPATV